MRTFATTLIAILTLVRTDAALPSQTPVAAGVWGGKGIQLTVREKGVTIDYGCDAGSIDGTLTVDGKGRFSADGRHRFGTGGPRSGEETTPAQRAHYEGTVHGTSLTVEVTLPDLKRSLGRFTAELGVRAALERCG
jgi:hypothetical protein